MSESKAASRPSSIARIDFVEPNKFELHGGGIRVTYLTSITPGLPQFIYQDAHRHLQFTHDQIRRVEVPDVGTLVSVTLSLTPDMGSTSFSVLLPQVKLMSSSPSTMVHTEGITTLHRMSISPALLQGQLETYTLNSLQGTAASVIVPL